MLSNAGVGVDGRLWISPRSHLIMPYHKILDGLYEEAKGAGATGTTRRGIGPEEREAGVEVQSGDHGIGSISVRGAEAEVRGMSGQVSM